MDAERIAWIAGIIEGEGSFIVTQGKVRVVVTMTDIDVLTRLRDFAGGSICTLKRRKAHWKRSWRWSLAGPRAAELTVSILPLMLSRRSGQAARLIVAWEASLERTRRRQAALKAKRRLAVELRTQGKTHDEIGGVIGLGRTGVTMMLLKYPNG